jgi:hypothetical protein
MPANLTPDYKAAEAAYRKARDPHERLACLREMLRTIPKHKGTDHLQADIKGRIRELTEELAGPRQTGARSGPPTVVHPEGAAQIALLGPPNSGKSALHARLTGSAAAAAPYPFTTAHPQPGMLPFEDTAFQLVDLPPISREHPIPWMANALQPADAAFLVVDLSDPACVEAVAEAVEVLASRKVRLTGRWPADGDPNPQDEDPFVLVLSTALLAAKADLVADPPAEVAALRELSGLDLPALAASTETGVGLDLIGRFLFERLAVVRVYTKVPGHPADRDRPYTLRRGQTVHDVAVLVHRELAGSLKYARVWGSGGGFAGQQVGRDHLVVDGDVVELHT